MNNRLQKLYAFMEQHDVDAMLVTLPKHIYYLTGFMNEPHERFMGLVLVKGEEPFLIVPLLDLDKARGASSITTIYPVSDEESPYELLGAKLPAALNRIAVEEEHLNVVRYRAVMEATSAKQSVDASGVLREMRMFKAPEELATMKRAIQMIEDVLRSVLPRVKPGVSELDLVAELEYQMKKHGAAGPAFDTMVLAGKKAGQPHGVPDSRKIEPGELVLFDTGGIVDGYHSDITRTFAVGDVNEQLVDMYETVLQANLAAIAAVRPGQQFADIDKAARDVIQRNGYGDFYLTRVGHGIGLEIHEYPSMHANNVEQAREGMVFTIEPGIYNPQLAGVRIEDNVYVTSTGVEVLTSFPKQLMVIGG